MKLFNLIIIVVSFLSLTACDNKPQKDEVKTVLPVIKPSMVIDDGRISLDLNPMQKNHQLSNMRSHLEAVQEILLLISEDKYDEASQTAYSKLGSTTEMRLMCASFGDKGFETLGLEFHKSADLMSEIIKQGDKDKSLAALSSTINYCVQCHKTYKQ